MTVVRVPVICMLAFCTNQVCVPLCSQKQGSMHNADGLFNPILATVTTVCSGFDPSSTVRTNFHLLHIFFPFTLTSPSPTWHPFPYEFCGYAHPWRNLPQSARNLQTYTCPIGCCGRRIICICGFGCRFILRDPLFLEIHSRPLTQLLSDRWAFLSVLHTPLITSPGPSYRLPSRIGWATEGSAGGGSVMGM